MLPIITALLPVLTSVLDKVIPNTAERDRVKTELALKLAEQETELLKLFTQVDTGQIETNKEEAKSNSLFVAGWRPFVGWTCASAFAWAFVLQPFLIFVLNIVGHPVDHKLLPVLDLATVTGMLSGLLGMGALRSFEKVKGVAR